MWVKNIHLYQKLPRMMHINIFSTKTEVGLNKELGFLFEIDLGLNNDATAYLARESAGEWRWRLKAVNGRIIADSAEGYINKHLHPMIHQSDQDQEYCCFAADGVHPDQSIQNCRSEDGSV